MREDGFGALHSDSLENEATWRTTPIEIPVSAQNLFVNGSLTVLRAEILDTSNNVIPGFSRAECNLTAGNSTSILIKWENANIQSLAGQTVKIKFYFALGYIYSFKFG